MEGKSKEEIRREVRQRYAGLAKGGCCSSGPSKQASCCSTLEDSIEKRTVDLGYSKEEITRVPEGANMGLGCGNPTAMASLKQGETVLDLGSGGGIDCFLAAAAVGETGKVIGVDMTPDMVSRARESAEKAGLKNVEFRLGEIEHLPAEDKSVDAIISNCVINLSPEKDRVFREAYRVLKPGGRLAVSDIVATGPLPEEVRKDLSLISACVGGAERVESIKKMLEETGFQDVKVTPLEASRDFIREWLPGKGLENTLASARIEAIKPGEKGDNTDQKGLKMNPMENKEIKKTVYGHYESGFHCAEVITKTVLEMFSGKPRPEATKAASVFGGGIGGSTEELCGAFTGGVIALGYLMGREAPGDNMRDAGALVKEFKSRFQTQFGALKCRDLLFSFDEQENPLGCVKLTAETSVLLANLLNQFGSNKKLHFDEYGSQPREKVRLGQCPFKPGACQC
jgi:C_GCAxxG_C_C family probable redox protein